MTLAEVASRCGVSRMTVSNAYNRPDQLSADLRQQVLATAEELGYGGPSAAGRALKRGRSDVLGVLLTEALPYAFGDPGTVSFLHGVTAETAAAGLALQLIPARAGDRGTAGPRRRGRRAHRPHPGGRRPGPGRRPAAQAAHRDQRRAQRGGTGLRDHRQ